MERCNGLESDLETRLHQEAIETRKRLLGYWDVISFPLLSPVVIGAGLWRTSEPHCAQGWRSEPGFLGIMDDDVATGGLGYI